MIRLRVVALVGVLLPLCVFIAAGARAADAEAGAAKPAELKLLEPLVGAWEYNGTEKSPSQPDPVERAGLADIKWILGGRFLHTNATTSNGLEAQALVTFDSERGQFRRWYFHSRVGFSESWGDFDKKSQTFTWKSEHLNGVTATLTDRHIDKNSRAWSVIGKNRDGQVVFQLDANSKRRSGDAPAEIAIVAPSDLSAELKILDRYVGTWDGKATLKAGPWVKQETKQSDAGVIKWAVGGRFLQINSSSPEGGEGLHFMSYDAQQQAYRHWFFHARHGASESTGRWDEQSKTFTWKSQLPMDMTANLTDHWVSDKQRDWKYIIEDRDGKTMFEMEATSTRRK